MKNIAPNISFEEACCRSCITSSPRIQLALNDQFRSWEQHVIDLVVYIDFLKKKPTKVVFLHVLQFVYKTGGFVKSIFEKTQGSPFLLKALSFEYEQIPDDHPYKVFVIMDIEGNFLFEVVAEEVLITEE